MQQFYEVLVTVYLKGMSLRLPPLKNEDNELIYIYRSAAFLDIVLCLLGGDGDVTSRHGF